MKKVLFCLSLIFGLLVLNQVPSFAMGFTISPETIGGLGDLGYGLLGGATFDFDGTEYVVYDWDNLSEAIKEQKAQEQARKFLQAYCIQRGIPIPNISPDLPASDPKAFYKSQYFNSANRSVWNNYKLGSTTIEQQDALRFPISPQAFSDWTEYNTFWYKKYMDQFVVEDNTPTPAPDPNYTNYLNNINTKYDNGSFHNFFWKDLTITNPNASFNIQPWVSNNYSYVYTEAGVYYYSRDFMNQSGYSTSFICRTAPVDINIIYSGTTYTYSVNVSPDIIGSQNSVNISNFSLNGSASTATINTFYNGTRILPAALTYTTSTLNNMFSHIQKYWRNVNIYVDDVLWSLAIDDAPANPTIPEFPDVIGGTDEDPIPAYDVILPNTDDQYGTFDITSIFDAIKEAIIGASDSDDTTSGTLTGDAVKDTFKDRAGEAVGELTDTIDAVLTDSFPLENTSNYPNLPPIPDAPISDALAGTTILSQLIDACQQILPEPLTLAFWGMIFILFIIGLIRILHK